MASSSLPVPPEREPYRHQKLPDGYFRILNLQPGKGSDPLACSLQSVSLKDPPFYEAITYVWGTNWDNVTVQCDGAELRSLSRNLGVILRELRSEDKPRALWADAICISMVDNEDKSQQITLMPEIFARCARVLIFPGGGEDIRHFEAASNLIKEADEIFCRTLARLGEDTPWDSFPWPTLREDNPTENDLLTEDARWASVAALLDQPWFNRGWTVQEAASAPAATILWGGFEIDWTALLRVHLWLETRAPRTAVEFGLPLMVSHRDWFERRHYDEWRAFTNEANRAPVGLLDHIDHGRRLLLTEPRDRIYAFLGLSRRPEEADLDFGINYSMSKAEVYRFFASAYIRQLGNLDILSMVDHNESSISDDSIPSWAPSWDVWTVNQPLDHPSFPRLASADNTTHFLPRWPDPRILEVRGVMVDEFRHIDATMTSDTTFDDMTMIYIHCIRAEEGGIFEYPIASHLPVAFVTALTTNQFFGSKKLWAQSLEALRAHLALAARFTSLRSLSDYPSYVYNFAKATTLPGRRFFVTQRGYIGLGPGCMQRGDVCCIIFGTRLPFILRKSKEREGCYQVVGQAWITGRQSWVAADNSIQMDVLGSERSKDWIHLGRKEEDIRLC